MTNNSQPRTSQLRKTLDSSHDKTAGRSYWPAALAALMLIAGPDLAAGQEDGAKAPGVRAFRFDATTDQATAELQFVKEPARPAKRNATVVRSSSRFAQAVVADRALRNGSRDDFRQDVQRMQSQGQAVYAGWYHQWLPRLRRGLWNLPFPFFGK